MAWVSRDAEVVGDVEVEFGQVNEPWDLGMCPPADAPLRFLVLHKAARDSETGACPSRRQMVEITKLTEEMTRAGVLLSAEVTHDARRVGTLVAV
jgi:hypothetical protein